MNYKRYICKLLWHKEDPEITDSGYPICVRCGAHGYYDDYTWDVRWMYWPVRFVDFLRWRVKSFVKSHRCAECGKYYWRGVDGEFCSQKCLDDWMPF